MAAVPDVTITAGVPTLGTGTVATLSKFEKAASTLPAASDVALVVTERDKQTLGQTTMNLSLPVAFASDQSWPVSTVGFMKKEDVASADGDAGIPAMAIRQATPANSSGTDGDYEMIKIDEGLLWAGLAPRSKGGCTISSTLIAAGTNAANIKASAGQLYGIEITNNSANIGYLKIYNTAGTPTAGTGTPVIRLMCPGNASGAGIVRSYDNGVAFGTGIGITFTGGIADADTTSVAASSFIVNLYYK